MANVNQVAGVHEIIASLRGYTAGMAAGFERGLKAAGLVLQRESQQFAPVEFGNLKASAYTAATGAGFSAVIEVGYTAAYALFVHEAVAMKLKGQPRLPSPPHQGHYWDPQGKAKAKFLEEPARRLQPQLLAIIAAQTKIP